FLDELGELKEELKELKELKKNKTFELVLDKQLNSAYYIEESEYDSSIIKSYLELRSKFGLDHDISFKFSLDKNLIDETTFKLLARNTEQKFKQNSNYKLARRIYKKFSVGDTIHIKSYCNEYNLDQSRFKKALISIWEVEKVTEGRKTFYKLLSRNVSTIFSKKEELKIAISGLIFR
ncbi:MAG: hypothetical protein ACRC6E_10585, partial [Fusobacteriaceae bacterium]